MAMMMTGRVLLVCALCVLWCGVFGIVADGACGGDADGSAVEYSLSRWRAQLRSECAEEVGRRTGGGANASAVEECLRQGTDGVRAVVDGRSRWRRQQFAVAAAADGDSGGNVKEEKTKTLSKELHQQPQDSNVAAPGMNESPGRAHEPSSIGEGGAGSEESQSSLPEVPHEMQNSLLESQKVLGGVGRKAESTVNGPTGHESAADGSGHIESPEIGVTGDPEKESSQKGSPKITASSQGAGTGEAPQPPTRAGGGTQKDPGIKNPETAETPGEQITQTAEQGTPQGGQVPKVQQIVSEPANKQSKVEQEVDSITTPVNAPGVTPQQEKEEDAENEGTADEDEAEEEIETQEDIAWRPLTPIRKKSSHSISSLHGSAASFSQEEKPTTQVISENLPISETVLEEGGRQHGDTATPHNVNSSNAPSSVTEPDTATTTKTMIATHNASNLNWDGVKPFTEEKEKRDETPNLNSASEGTKNTPANSEVPTTATEHAKDITNTTPPADSDGSTAVSHTTSPLLLLVVVACAAAAAVVAA
ncbi:Mucin-associated surface protein (MASP) [Trypanosoma cruzi]|uniref:Mucin-associated surface protein (MASP), putative n=2 Tax=Trypanosoma cruzi TaxID=5693 RepID=Q4DU50_TRYCC|nr:mucin-associated surface protein (MASP), putative [Trypanosoma cruzi]EAN96049.1 mucin-associated surface protein (MASP), putative [Trypanosoma cruzi]PWV06196.1 Mucin-associated surface protein (MASP) [Trypanosoma cruzi]|eukprot:XP_817900.1 mucin-associated surface protein (MASP) [Trypanosoma cruzi strain CL Brener]